MPDGGQGNLQTCFISLSLQILSRSLVFKILPYVAQADKTSAISSGVECTLFFQNEHVFDLKCMYIVVWLGDGELGTNCNQSHKHERKVDSTMHVGRQASVLNLGMKRVNALAILLMTVFE